MVDIVLHVVLDLNGGDPVIITDRINFEPDDSFDPSSLRDQFDDDLTDTFDNLNNEEPLQEEVAVEEQSYVNSNMISIGTPVEVYDPYGQWIPGVVSGFDKDKYRVRYPNGTEENDIEALRVRLPQIHLSNEEVEMKVIMSEILESERQYNIDLQNLNSFYVHKLKGAAHWGGEIERNESLFSQRTLNDEEAKQVFSNIEEIVEMNRAFLKDLEATFSTLESDQSLATNFVEWAPKFKLYAEYVVRFEDSQKLIAKYRNERMGFRSADEAAQNYQIQPLQDLMKKPIARTKEYMNLLQRLQQRTPIGHKSRKDADRAMEIFRDVEAYMNACINMRANQQKIREIETRFSPSINLSDKKDRVFFLQKELNRMENGNSKLRHILIFNDVAVCARTSEFLNRGAFRNLGMLDIGSYGDKPQYGPLAFYIASPAGETWTLIAMHLQDKEEVFNKLSVSQRLHSKQPSATNLGDATMRLREMRFKRISSEVPPPPPPPPRIPAGWIELVDTGSGKVYFFNQQLNKTQWERPQ